MYLYLGVRLTKIHRIRKLKQSDWMKKYVGFNTQRKTNAANSFEKDFFKLTINSVCSKTTENLENVRLGNNKKDFLKYTSRPTNITHKIFDKNYGAIHEIKPALTFITTLLKNSLMLNCYLLSHTVLLLKAEALV